MTRRFTAWYINWGAQVLTARTRKLQRYRDGQLPAGHDLDGQYVVAQVDGGRVRIRTQIETKKCKGMKPRCKIRLEWHEPKLLIVDLSDRRGRMVKGMRPWIDGMLDGPDHLMELLAFHWFKDRGHPLESAERSRARYLE